MYYAPNGLGAFLFQGIFMTEDEKELNRLINRTIYQQNYQEKPDLFQKSADTVANFGGSWLFILLFLCFFGSWLFFNIYIYYFDENFLKLNLILSCLAVFQAPFILMSQNRMTEIDRKREERAYKLSMKAEHEIKILDKKLDALLENFKIKADS